ASRLRFVVGRFAVLQLFHPPVDEVARRFGSRRRGTTLFHVRDDFAQPLRPFDRFFAHGFFFLVRRAISSCNRFPFAAPAVSTFDRAARTSRAFCPFILVCSYASGVMALTVARSDSVRPVCRLNGPRFMSSGASPKKRCWNQSSDTGSCQVR